LRGFVHDRYFGRILRFHALQLFAQFAGGLGEEQLLEDPDLDPDLAHRGVSFG